MTKTKYLMSLPMSQTHEITDLNITIRPWGSFRTIEKPEGGMYHIKKLVVNPEARLSLQYHNHRSEHWVVTKGMIIAQVGHDFHSLHENQSIYIPKGVKHRIICVSSIPAEIVEVQFGNILDEDDIVRLDDMYGRANNIIDV